ncbi:MAG: anaerobic nitric oxide reductase flavorubredoxin [Actinobacteria bacterium]|nr:anaerobic nitric oxide reductase flavorubredoxin [Cyanobacteriota bacterium]MCL6087329.1 anaerobic nitric oxide reductase flavorubredoxin [Actinomycetota bacterium]
MNIKVNDNVTWVGKVDWELRKFHGEELSTFRGSSYNSYLVRDEKTALIDTVWMPFSKEYIEKLSAEIELDKIDYVIANHAEMDHSGALPALMEKIPGKPVYCTQNGIRSLKGHYHKDWNFIAVKTGDKLSLGRKELIFIEAKMLHWPDSMFTYLSGDNILFSNDAFGQHFANEMMFNDLVDEHELYEEAIKYYANILTPFANFIEQKINELLDLKLPVNMICPSHGIIWRNNPMQIINKYLEWARAYQENQITVVYDTMWNGTRQIAETIIDGIKSKDKKADIKLYNSARHDINTIITEIFKSKTVLIGSPTVNRGILISTAALIEFIKGLKFKNKNAAAFGSFGWSGESVKIITEELAEAGLEILNEGIKIQWHPGSEDLIKIFEYGRDLGDKIKEIAP